MADIKKIRAAIEKRHGRGQTLDDTRIMIIWDSIDPETQKEYLKDERKSHADNIRPASDLPGDPGD